MREAGLEKVEDYVLNRYNALIQYIATRPILELYDEVV